MTDPAPVGPRQRVADYCFTSTWYLDAPRLQVWAELAEPGGWQRWWPGLKSVRALAPGDFRGVGARWRLRWRGRLPHTLDLEIRIIEVEPGRWLTGVVSGGLVGWGRWSLEDDPGSDGATVVCFDWRVDGPEPWMHPLAPALRPWFRRNFHGLMAAGRDGLARHLADS